MFRHNLRRTATIFGVLLMVVLGVVMVRQFRRTVPPPAWYIMAVRFADRCELPCYAGIQPGRDGGEALDALAGGRIEELGSSEVEIDGHTYEISEFYDRSLRALVTVYVNDREIIEVVYVSHFDSNPAVSHVPHHFPAFTEMAEFWFDSSRLYRWLSQGYGIVLNVLWRPDAESESACLIDDDTILNVIFFDLETRVVSYILDDDLFERATILDCE